METIISILNLEILQLEISVFKFIIESFDSVTPNFTFLFLLHSVIVEHVSLTLKKVKIISLQDN